MELYVAGLVVEQCTGERVAESRDYFEIVHGGAIENHDIRPRLNRLAEAEERRLCVHFTSKGPSFSVLVGIWHFRHRRRGN